MKKQWILLSVLFVLPLSAFPLYLRSAKPPRPPDATFENLDQWETLRFPDIERLTEYRIVEHGNDPYLQMVSDDSASALIHQKTFDVYRYPRLRWRWNVQNVYDESDVRRKSGDDYPARVYVAFHKEKEELNFFERLRRRAARAYYGRYPPESALSYVWAGRNYDKRYFRNAYTDEVRMVILREGEEHAGNWVKEEVDLLRDYRNAFGEDPPRRARLILMNDSDNTGEAAVSCLDDLQALPAGS
jgi:hypothetical protein